VLGGSTPCSKEPPISTYVCLFSCYLFVSCLLYAGSSVCVDMFCDNIVVFGICFVFDFMLMLLCLVCIRSDAGPVEFDMLVCDFVEWCRDWFCGVQSVFSLYFGCVVCVLLCYVVVLRCVVFVMLCFVSCRAISTVGTWAVLRLCQKCSLRPAISTYVCLFCCCLLVVVCCMLKFGGSKKKHNITNTTHLKTTT